MAEFRRYAVYFAPRPDSALARFGASWLGRDAETGAAMPEARIEELPRPWAELVAAPRRYGFHATLKAPFRLAPGRDAAALDAALRDLAQEFERFALPLRLSAPGPFLALTEARPVAALGAVAAACVTRLDGFRAPADAAELARRRAAGLTPAQEAHLRDWGYPYVLDAFEFHLSLTGELAPAVQARTAAALAPVLAPLLATPTCFADLCLFGEAADGAFHVVRRHALRPAEEVRP